MDTQRFDTVAKLFASHRLSRRQALTQGGVGLAAGALAISGRTAAAQDTATPPAPAADHGPTMLFVQSFQSGSIVPKEGQVGRYTVTLESGLGQTIYFSDRPDRLVGATPTDRFLAGLGFPDDNPPNAALVVETAPGETDLAVVELFNPVYDPAGPTVTYDVAVLANWADSLELGFTAAPADLATIEPTFGAAHLFIDGCPGSDIACSISTISEGDTLVGNIPGRAFDDFCYNPTIGFCIPCTPWYDDAISVIAYWTEQCNTKVSGCTGACVPYYRCTNPDSGRPFESTVCELL